jgi:hypothetical protein
MVPQVVQEGLEGTMITRVKTVPMARTMVEPLEELKETQAQEEQTLPTLQRIEAGTCRQPRQPNRRHRTQILTPTGQLAITLSVSTFSNFNFICRKS